MPILALSQPVVNVYGFHGTKVGAFFSVFSEGRRHPPPSKETDPFGHFVLVNLHHSGVDIILSALEQSDRYMLRIRAGG